MSPGIVVAGGGGGGGPGGGGSGSGSGGGQGSGTEDGGENADGGGNNAGSCGPGGGEGGCPSPSHGGGGGAGTTAGDPVDILTGKTFTSGTLDLGLPGPLPLVILRMYSSSARERDVGLGYGWTHSLAWEIEVRRRLVTIYKDDGTRVDVPNMAVGDKRPIVEDMILRREAWGFGLTLPDGRFLLFMEPDPTGHFYRLSAVYDRNCNFISLHYERGVLVELRDAVGRAVRVRREGQRIRAFETQGGEEHGWVRFWTYTYSAEGDLVSATDAEGHAVRYVYENHLLTSQTYRSGLTVYYRYDRQDRCIETWGNYPDRHDPSLAEDVPTMLADGQTRAKGVLHAKILAREDGYVEVADSVRVRRIFGNRFGKADQLVVGHGVHSQEFDKLGRLTSYTDPLGATTSFERDEAGHVQCVVDPLGRSTSYTYDWRGGVREIGLPNGKRICFERDAYSNLTAVDDELGNVVSYRYDSRGQLVEAELPNGGITRFELDQHGNRTAVIEPDGATKRLTYDYLGRVTSVSDPMGNVTKFNYDTRGLLAVIHLPDGGLRQYAYDAEGRLAQCSDSEGRQLEFEWGGLNVLVEIRRTGGAFTKLRYNREGQFVELENEKGERHRFERDQAGHVVREETLDGRVSSLKRDPFGRLIERRTESGELTEFEYDAAGQLLARRYDDDSSDEFEYDPQGRVVAARHMGAEVRYTYDSRGRVTNETQVVEGVPHTLESQYDVMGKRTARRTSLGHVETMVRDVMGRVSGLCVGDRDNITFERDLLGRELASVLPGGARIEYAYDALARLVSRRVVSARGAIGTSGAGPIWVGRQPGTDIETQYAYSAGGDLRYEHDARKGTTELSYDPLGQLLSRLPNEAREEAYRYDVAGNLHDGTPRGSHWAHEAGPKDTYETQRAYGPGGRLLSRGTTSYEYDEAARLVEKRTRRPDGTDAIWTYEYDGRGLLAKVTSPDGEITDFVYDVYARRLLKRTHTPDGVLTKKTRFVWDGDSLVHEIRERASAQGDPIVEQRTYVYPDGSIAPLAHRDGSEGEWHFYVSSPTGFPETLVSSQGDELARIEHTAFGQIRASRDAAQHSGERMSEPETPLRYPGQYADEETGLYYNRYRYYDPEVCRYITPDPSETKGGNNLYTYADNSPTTRIDIDGLQAVTSINGEPLGTSQRGRDPNNPPHLHPTVWENMAPSMQNGMTPQGGRDPASCGEPEALSNHLYQYEHDNGLPYGTCGHPANDPDNGHLRAALSGVDRIQTTTQSGHQLPACPNCGELLRNLQNQANTHAGPNDPHVDLTGAYQGGIDPPVPEYNPAAANVRPQNSTAVTAGQVRVQPPFTPGGSANVPSPAWNPPGR